MSQRTDLLLKAIQESSDLKGKNSLDILKKVIDATEDFTKSVYISDPNNPYNKDLWQASQSLSDMYSKGHSTNLDKTIKNLGIDGKLFTGFSNHVHPDRRTPETYIAFNINGHVALNRGDHLIALEPEPSKNFTSMPAPALHNA